MSIGGYVSTHPYQIAGGLFCVGVIGILYVRSLGGSKSAAAPVVLGYDPGYNAAVVAQNGQVAAATLSAQARAADLKASLDAHVNDNATAIQVAEISNRAALAGLTIKAETAQHSDNLAQSVAIHGTDTAYQTAVLQAQLATFAVSTASYSTDKRTEAQLAAKTTGDAVSLAALQIQNQTVRDAATLQYSLLAQQTESQERILASREVTKHESLLLTGHF